MYKQWLRKCKWFVLNRKVSVYLTPLLIHKLVVVILRYDEGVRNSPKTLAMLKIRIGLLTLAPWTA